MSKVLVFVWAAAMFTLNGIADAAQFMDVGRAMSQTGPFLSYVMAVLVMLISFTLLSILGYVLFWPAGEKE